MVVPQTPIITQTWPTTGDLPPVDTAVADITQPEGDTATDITYEMVANPTGLAQVSGTTITLSGELPETGGAGFTSVKAVNADGESAEGGTTLVFGDNENPYDDSDDPYHDNPNLPPPLPPGTTEVPFDFFLRQATLLLFPYARVGWDFMVARAQKTAPFTNVYWNEDTLGPRPDAEIEALAKQLAADTPFAPVEAP